MKQTLLLLLLMICSTYIFAQTNSEKAYQLAVKAVKEMDQGNTAKAISMLDEAISLDPDKMTYPYELAYAYYLQKDFEKSIKILKKLKKHENANDRIYQMLGNCFDFSGKPEKAIETYENGLELFPSSGPLHLERGNMELKAKSYNKALNYYETGIKVDPSFASNYYWAAKIYLGSTEEVWGMIYGELFINLERNSERTAEISEILYSTYKQEIDLTSDTSKGVSFSKTNYMNVDQMEDTANFKLPFGMIYEIALSVPIAMENEITIASLNRIRRSFIQYYYRQGNNQTHPNPLFNYHKMLMDKGYFTPYNYFVLMKGDQQEFTEWINTNEDKWNEFLVWYYKNPINLSSKNQFYREMY